MGCVYIIGAGPGDPGLITARGLRLLSEADVVVYDRAVEAVLRWANPDAELIAAGAPAERQTAQDAISILLAEKARDGHTVARLKWGDPFVFDSGAKEALFLYDQQVPFEVVPGVPSAIGTTAYAGIPLSYPGAGDGIVFLRGHEGEIDETPEVDWDALSRIDGTFVCWAGARLIPRVLASLVEHGTPPDRAAALIFQGTLPSQRTVTGTIGELLTATEAETPSGPALLVAGDIVGLRDHLRWFDARPLFGRRIIVTRSPEQAVSMVEALENLGAQAIQAPTFQMLPPDDPEALERAAASIDTYQWVVFESATAVTRLLAVLARGPRDLRALGRVSLCAIGPSTAERLIEGGLKPDVVMPEFRADNISEALAARGALEGQRVLVVRPDHLHEVLAQDLARRGAAVTDLIAYRTSAAAPDSSAAQELYRELLEGRIDAVSFTSPSAVSRFAKMIGAEQAADLLNTTVVAAIGPVTAAAALELGIHPTVVADEYTVDGLVRGIVKHFSVARAERGSSRT